ncbi:MAG: membrane or secreted protein [Bacteroidota bacterium]|nr:membrane or secreted protein [Bacteroidota bacterium]
MTSSASRIFLLLALLTFVVLAASAQITRSRNPVYIDRDGVMRWQDNKAEASFYGVNYTTPFAHAYRAHKVRNVDIEEAIRRDVYHLARLGLDAFRVHVWDNEISDVEGNLLENDHLRLYDFLLAELKKRNIKTIVTPIAFWGNGYPERDMDVPGFSQYYGRRKLTTNDSAISAQENFLRQFFKHVNPYTKVSYQDDDDVIAVEINNEPAHSGPKPGVTAYINRLAAAIKSTGWTKPIFYNISQGPYYADAVAASVAQGFSFQWYPSGLVSNNTLRGNYLPHVDAYTIPFDTIPAFRKKPLMVYEFDAADILASYMYPMMAKSFRQAGFQWATQFAYDPMAIADVNTEYQTHYLNLAYTPSKAISMLIASRVFHNVPRLKNYGSYPADSVFDSFRVSYRDNLSEMNTATEFYYSNATRTKPVEIGKLARVAGVGSSSVVNYSGSGAYFLDKLADGIWRMEVMPDAIHIRDPFERASPRKEVTRIEWNTHAMEVRIPGLGADFSISGLNEGNNFTSRSEDQAFLISPGTYLLSAVGKQFSGKTDALGPIQLTEFAAPKPREGKMFLHHQPLAEISAGKPFSVGARIVGMDSGRVSLQINKVGGQFRNIPMQWKSGSLYSAEVPAELVTPGMLNYRIVVRSEKETASFPGDHKGDPFAWDNYHNETWQTFVAGDRSALALYNPTDDQAVRTFPTFRRGFQTTYVTAERPHQLILRMTGNELADQDVLGFDYVFVDKLAGRLAEMETFDKIVIRARSTTGSPVKAKVLLMCADAASVSAVVTLTDQLHDIEVPLNSMAPDAALLLPRPYPGFLPLTFRGPATKEVDLKEAERIQLTVGPGVSPSEKKGPYGFEVEGIWLGKRSLNPE